jgi:hypothetical protein
MKKVLWLIVCLMTMVVSANAHNVHYPTYTEDGITYVLAGVSDACIDGSWYQQWNVLKVDKPNDRTITIPSKVTIDGKEVVVRGIRENAFSTCTSIDSLIISDGITIGNCHNTFKGCRELEYLYYSNGGYCGKANWLDGQGPVHDMEYYGLHCKTLETTLGCAEQPFWRTIGGSLEKLIIRDTNRFYSNVDEFCPNLKTIVCYSTTPPFTGHARSPYVYSGAGCYITFEPYQWSTITLYVPRESLEKYYFDRVWGEIDNIYAIDGMNNDVSTSISSIPNNTNENGVWHSLNGTKIDKPTKGVYIKNGKKYIVK